MQISARELARILNGTVEGDPDTVVTKPSTIENGSEGSITFLANERYESFAYTTDASLILVSKDFVPKKELKPTLLRVENVYEAVGTLLNMFGEVDHPGEGISEQARVSEEADIGEDVSIGSESVVESGARLGNGCVLYPQVYIGKDVSLGEGCVIFPGVRIYHRSELGRKCVVHANTVIGSDGFGFARNEEGRFDKISQIGNVVIEDEVEIGSCCAIDRATMGSTRICKGVKLDNLIQVAHNVEIGEDTAIAAQVGIAGSTKIGARCMIGGQAGFGGHLSIADDTQIQAQSGVAASVPEKGTKLYGSPAIEYSNFLRSYAAFRNLSDTLKRIRELEKQVETLKEQLDED